MKTKIAIPIILLIAVVTMAMTFPIDKFAGRSTEQDNVIIFAYSKPVTHYDILGMVKVKGMVKSEKATHMVKLLLEYAKKEYPSVEAIIINSEFDKAEVIKFKE